MVHRFTSNQFLDNKRVPFFSFGLPGPFALCSFFDTCKCKGMVKDEGCGEEGNLFMYCIDFYFAPPPGKISAHTIAA